MQYQLTKDASVIQRDQNGKLKHLLTLESVTRDEILSLLKDAQSFIDSAAYQGKTALGKISNPLAGQTVVNLFFEASTRTLCSFELAAKRLGAQVVNFETHSSSLKKGETLLDTVLTLNAMHVDAFVIRHEAENFSAWIAEQMPSSASIINGGDGKNAHPSQALLDVLTIQQKKPKFSELSVAIVGDVAHSRVARSSMQALKILGVKDLRVIAPDHFISDDIRRLDVEIYEDMDAGLAGCDVVMMLRVQKERLGVDAFPNEEKYHQQYGLTKERLKKAKPDAIVMHPGPMNRGIEIANEVADGPQSVILDQVRNGVAVRMAVLKNLLER